jgi:hypothetical protein
MIHVTTQNYRIPVVPNNNTEGGAQGVDIDDSTPHVILCNYCGQAVGVEDANARRVVEEQYLVPKDHLHRLVEDGQLAKHGPGRGRGIRYQYRSFLILDFPPITLARPKTIIYVK